MVGIYALWFEEPAMVYVGQSQNIQKRYKKHLTTLKGDNHSNYKVQGYYNKYGVPDLVILELCKLDQLNNLEIVWTEEFDSISKGLNIIEAGGHGYGVNSPTSKYTRRQVLRVFSLLYKTKYSYPVIAKYTKTSESLVSGISNNRNHLWLKETYPTKYDLMNCRIKPVGNPIYSRNTILKVFSLLCDPLLNNSEISRKLKVPRSLVVQIKNGYTHLWLKDTYPLKYTKMLNKEYKYTSKTSFKLISPVGEIVEVSNLTEFVRQNFNYSIESWRKYLGHVKSNKRLEYKGWRLKCTK